MSPIRLLFVLAILGFATPVSANKPRDEKLTFIFVHDTNTTTMSGNLTDLKRVRKALKQGERVLWFRTADNKEFVIRDAATLSQFEAAWKAAEAISVQMGELGGKQGIIGAKQGALGTKQGVLGMRQGLLSTEQADLDQRADTAKTATQREVIAKRRRVIEGEIRELERKMRTLEDRMRELEKPMQALEQEMEVVQKQHEAASDKAHADTEVLIARALTSGVAKPF